MPFFHKNPLYLSKSFFSDKKCENSPPQKIVGAPLILEGFPTIPRVERGPHGEVSTFNKIKRKSYLIKLPSFIYGYNKLISFITS